MATNCEASHGHTPTNCEKATSPCGQRFPFVCSKRKYTRLRVFFGDVKNLTVSILLEKNIFDKFIQIIFPHGRMFFPFHSGSIAVLCLTPSTNLFERCDESKETKTRKNGPGFDGSFTWCHAVLRVVRRLTIPGQSVAPVQVVWLGACLSVASSHPKLAKRRTLLAACGTMDVVYGRTFKILVAGILRTPPRLSKLMDVTMRWKLLSVLCTWEKPRYRSPACMCLAVVQI